MNQSLTDSEVSVFAEQLAVILHSGISSLEGISILKEDAPSKEGGQFLEQVYDTLEQTGSLAEALRDTKLCPDYFVKMTEIGERSGTLEEVMASLSDYYNRQNALTRSIRDALTWPLLFLGMLLAILVVLMTQVMPVFQKVFEQLGIEVTGISSTVFRLSSYMQNGSMVLLGIIILIVCAVLIGLRTLRGRTFLTALVQHLPFTRTISMMLACSRFSDALSIALHSGLDMGESFELASDLTEHPDFHKKLDKAGELMEQGNEFGDSLRQADIFTGLNARMASIGFRTGTAEEVLKKIAVSSQDEATEQIQNKVGALEPILTAVLSILTGMILISVMLPLLGVMANIG